MALPIAHAAAGIGFARTRNLPELIAIALIAISPDFDFALVWGLGLPVEVYHRTFSHSLFFAALVYLLFLWIGPVFWGSVPPILVFLALLSHSLVDMACTADALDHGVMLFWPFSNVRLGWPVVVPLYAYFAESPFSVEGAFRFTVLEVFLAPFYWAGTALLGGPLRRVLFQGARQ